MTGWLYTVRQRFMPSMPGWKSYIEFSGFDQIVELVTLDSMMCPNMLSELRKEDWEHNVHEDWRTELFYDADYLIARDGFDENTQQVLGIICQPRQAEPPAPKFETCGFDIMDSYFGNSTLTNCGRIPEAFSPSIVNQYGLIADVDLAYSIRDKMRRLQPDDPHLSKCEVWQICRRR